MSVVIRAHKLAKPHPQSPIVFDIDVGTPMTLHGEDGANMGMSLTGFWNSSYFLPLIDSTVVGYRRDFSLLRGPIAK